MSTREYERWYERLVKAGYTPRACARSRGDAGSAGRSGASDDGCGVAAHHRRAGARPANLPDDPQAPDSGRLPAGAGGRTSRPGRAANGGAIAIEGTAMIQRGYAPRRKPPAARPRPTRCTRCRRSDLPLSAAGRCWSCDAAAAARPHAQAQARNPWVLEKAFFTTRYKEAPRTLDLPIL